MSHVLLIFFLSARTDCPKGA